MSIINTTIGGPLGTGTTAPGSATPDVGLTQLAQSVTISSTTTASATLYLPPNSQIISFITDIQTAYDSVTSATLSIGTAAADTTYVGSFNAKTGGRTVPTYAAAAVTAMSNIGTNTAVVATVTIVGTTTTGTVQVTCMYIQK